MSDLPFRLWCPDAEGRGWVEAPGKEAHETLEDAEDAFVGDRRVAERDDDWLVIYDWAKGYMAIAREAGDPTDPLDALCAEEDLFSDGELAERPTLLGALGGHPGWSDPDDRYEEVLE